MNNVVNQLHQSSVFITSFRCSPLRSKILTLRRIRSSLNLALTPTTILVYNASDIHELLQRTAPLSLYRIYNDLALAASFFCYKCMQSTELQHVYLFPSVYHLMDQLSKHQNIPGSSATVVLQAHFFCNSEAKASASNRNDSIPESLVTFLFPCLRSVMIWIGFNPPLRTT